MASCPNCGFDLTQTGACPVCGYGSSSNGSRLEPAGNATAREPHARAPRRLAVLLGVLVGCLIVAATAGGFVLLHSGSTPSAEESLRPQPLTQVGPATPERAAGQGNGRHAVVVSPVTSAGSKADGSPNQAIAEQESAGTETRPASATRVERAAKAVDLHDPTAGEVYDITKRTDFPPTADEGSYVAWMVKNTNQQEKYLRERWQRAQIAVQRRHITRDRILMGFLLTPREWFARSYNLPKVYDNTALPIGYGQTISGPDLVARMTDYLDPQPDQKVFEIGTGSGYQSAFLAHLSNYVYTIEIVKPLAEETNAIYTTRTKAMPELGNIHRRMADGYFGWPEYAPFDRIIVTAGIDHIPPDLLKELTPGGIMVIPIGPPSGQTILKITKTVGKDGNVTLTREDIYHGFAKDIFVPFTASNGGTHYLGDAGKN